MKLVPTGPFLALAAALLAAAAGCVSSPTPHPAKGLDSPGAEPVADGAGVETGADAAPEPFGDAPSPEPEPVSQPDAVAEPEAAEPETAPEPEPAPEQDAAEPDVGDVAEPDGGDTEQPDGGDTEQPDGGDTAQPDGGDIAEPDGGDTAEPDPVPDGKCTAEKPCPIPFESCFDGDDPFCGICQTPETTCADDAGCAEGTVCVNHPVPCPCFPAKGCVAACKGAADCELGEVCLADGHCAPKPCNAEDECPADFTCAVGEGECVRTPCASSSDCDGSCVNGLCWAEPGFCSAPPP